MGSVMSGAQDQGVPADGVCAPCLWPWGVWCGVHVILLLPTESSCWPSPRWHKQLSSSITLCPETNETYGTPCSCACLTLRGLEFLYHLIPTALADPDSHLSPCPLPRWLEFWTLTVWLFLGVWVHLTSMCLVYGWWWQQCGAGSHADCPFFFFKCIFVCMSVCLYICLFMLNASHVSLVPTEARRRHRIPTVPRYLWAAMWALGTELGSPQEEQVLLTVEPSLQSP